MDAQPWARAVPVGGVTGMSTRISYTMIICSTNSDPVLDRGSNGEIQVRPGYKIRQREY